MSRFVDEAKEFYDLVGPFALTLMTLLGLSCGVLIYILLRYCA